MATLTLNAITPILVSIPSKAIRRGFFRRDESLQFVANRQEPCEVYLRSSGVSYERVLTWYGKKN